MTQFNALDNLWPKGEYAVSGSLTLEEFRQIVGIDIDVFRSMSLKKRREIFSRVGSGDKLIVSNSIAARNFWAEYAPGTLVFVYWGGSRFDDPGVVIFSNGGTSYQVFIHDVGIVPCHRYDICHA